jgi:DNA-binding NtrC family response regulator
VPNRPLVAIVDDDKSIRDTTKDLLESAGFAAVKFASASLLLKSRRMKSISCLVTDMRMPEMTGLELQQHLVGSNHAIPTIRTSACERRRSRATSSVISLSHSQRMSYLPASAAQSDVAPGRRIEYA